jgi:hypothetical protein
MNNIGESVKSSSQTVLADENLIKAKLKSSINLFTNQVVYFIVGF